MKRVICTSADLRSENVSLQVCFTFVEASERKAADTEQFIGIVRKYSEISKLTHGIIIH